MLRWGEAQGILSKREWYEAHPLDGIAACVRADLVAPDWLARPFLRQYSKVLNCDAATWDEAFGPAHYVKGHLATLKRRRMFGMQIQMMFTGPEKLPRTEAGYQQAAARTGLTPKQVKDMLPKTRNNVRGHKPYGWKATSSGNANDPFKLARKPKS